MCQRLKFLVQSVEMPLTFDPVNVHKCMIVYINLSKLLEIPCHIRCQIEHIYCVQAICHDLKVIMPLKKVFLEAIMLLRNPYYLISI